MKEEIKKFLPTADAFSRLLFPLAEVVVHDLKKDVIVAIFNPLSKRKVGDSSYLERVDFDLKEGMPEIIGPYEKLNYDGRPLKSISVVIRDKKKLAIGFLCVNLDISIFSKYSSILNAFLSNRDESISEKNQTLFKDDLYERLNVFIQKYCLENNLNFDSLSRLDKKQLILKLQEEGALQEKNATLYIARTLGVSRATVYNYLNEGVHNE